MKKLFLILILLSSLVTSGCGYLSGKFIGPLVDPLVDKYSGQLFGTGTKLAKQAFTGDTDVAHNAFGTGLGGYDLVVLQVYGRFVKGSKYHTAKYNGVTFYFHSKVSLKCFNASPRLFMQRLLFYGNAMDTLKLSQDPESVDPSQENILRTSNGFVAVFSNQVEKIAAQEQWLSDPHYCADKLSLWIARAEDPVGIPAAEREKVFNPTFLKPWDVARIPFLEEWPFYKNAEEYASNFQFPDEEEEE